MKVLLSFAQFEREVKATTLASRLATSEQRRVVVGAIVERVRLLDDRVELHLDRKALLGLL